MNLPSIVRNGNHFIAVEGAEQIKWTLIDGPWYQQLMRLYRPNGMNVIRCPLVVPLGCFEFSDEPPPMTELSYAEWKAVIWLPGNSMNRHYVGWYVLPDGRLPLMFYAGQWKKGLESLVK